MISVLNKLFPMLMKEAHLVKLYTIVKWKGGAERGGE